MLKWLGKEVLRAFLYTTWGVLVSVLTLMTIGYVDKLVNK